ncbi:MAG TPA: phosphate signaling complex protein PhoU [Acidimicrobiales bacterium]|nr:phosphate signaling complex protein PhoU [Acidimicrobiales bacterium]
MDTRRRYHDQLRAMKADTVRLASMAIQEIEGGTQALLDADLAAAERVMASDVAMDDLTHAIEEKAYVVLARQNPMARDLRTVVAILRLIHEVERCGDLMVNVAKSTRRLYPYALDPRVRGLLERMGTQAADQLRTAIAAFQEGDLAQAAAVADMDDVMDDLQKSLFRTIFTGGAADEAQLQQAVQVALIGRYYERIADHAVNVGARVPFMVTGEWGLVEDAGADEPGEPPAEPAPAAGNGAAEVIP